MEFTKRDLRSGDVIETRLGDRFLILADTPGQHHLLGIKINGTPYWKDLDGYTNDMRCEGVKSFDIMKVWRVVNRLDRPWDVDTSEMLLMFEREDVREMTLEELKNLLGYTVKIVEG